MIEELSFQREVSQIKSFKQTERVDWLPLQKMWVFLRSYVVNDSAVQASQTILVTSTQSSK